MAEEQIWLLLLLQMLMLLLLKLLLMLSYNNNITQQGTGENEQYKVYKYNQFDSCLIILFMPAEA